MADPNRQAFSPQHQQQHQTGSTAYHVVRAATAVTAGGSLLLLSGLFLLGTVIALIIATPVLVIFSPVLVPAVITVSLIGGGFVASGGFGMTAVAVLKWMYDYVAGNHPAGAEQIDHAKETLMGKAKDIKEFGQHQLTAAGQTVS